MIIKEENPRNVVNSPSGINPKEHLNDDIKKLLRLLNTTKHTFDVQVKVRNSLFKKIRRRLNVPREKYEEFFRHHFNELDEEEKKIHRTIRGFTKNILFEYNSAILNLIKDNETLLALDSITQLKNHLIIWASKYESVFKDDESMCLIYAGVDEKVPHPLNKDIEDELRTKLDFS